MWEDEDFTEFHACISGKEGLHMPKVGKQHTNSFTDFVNMLVP